MAGKVKGVGPRIERLYPRATLCWCAAHQLNLVIVASCTEVYGIRNMASTASGVGLLLSHFPKVKVADSLSS